MRKFNSAVPELKVSELESPELTDEELAFEMIEVTCEEMDSLAKAFEMISDLCVELNGEEPSDDSLDNEFPSESEIH